MRRTNVLLTICLIVLPSCSLSPEIRFPDPAVRIIAFGDSATRGPAIANYPEMLPNLLGLPNEAVANEGEPGEETSAGVERLTRIVERQTFPNADTLIIWQGGTDVIHFAASKDGSLQLNPADEAYPLREELMSLLDRIEGNLREMVDRGSSAGWKVYLVTYYPMSIEKPCAQLGLELDAHRGEVIDLYLSALNERIRSAVDQHGAGLIDVATIGEELRSDAGNYFDCNHLSQQGNARVAGLVAESLGR